MKFLFDTQILLWAAGHPGRLSAEARDLLSDKSHEPCFSPASLWEVAIKAGLGREDFRVDPHILRRGLLENGFLEIPISSRHAVGTFDLPLVHKDPFDRLLLAQALAEGITLVTADSRLASYPGPVRKV